MNTVACRDSRRHPAIWLGVFAMFLFLMPDVAHAGAAGAGLPYETWLDNLRASITGPVAFALGIIGVVIAGGVLIFGGELNAFSRTLIFLVLVMALIVGANNILTGFFATPGAVV
jgi:type IV secretion system protein TrbC